MTQNQSIERQAREFLSKARSGIREVSREQYIYFENLTDSEQDLIYSLHYGRLPNDSVYEMIYQILKELSQIYLNYGDRTEDFFTDFHNGVFKTDYELKQWFLENPLADEYIEVVMIAESFSENDSLIEKLYRAYEYYITDMLETVFNYFFDVYMKTEYEVNRWKFKLKTGTTEFSIEKAL